MCRLQIRRVLRLHLPMWTQSVSEVLRRLFSLGKDLLLVSPQTSQNVDSWQITQAIVSINFVGIIILYKRLGLVWHYAIVYKHTSW